MGFKQLARKTFDSISRGYGGSYGGGFLGDRFQATGRDWNREAGVRYDNSIVYAAIMYAINALTEVDIYVGQPVGEGKFKEIPNHPVTLLLNNPNPWYDFTTLLSGWVVSELSGPGYSCTYKHRSSAGKVVGLEYVPHFGIFPYAAPGSGNFIDYWQLNLTGGYRIEKPEDILQQRFGFINPLRPQSTIGPIQAALLEVVTDKQAANYTAALLANVGVTPHLISPALKDMDGTDIVFTKEQAAQIRARFEESITGDNRGRPMISPLPIKVDSLSFSPDDMNLEAIRNISEERICAVLGIPPLALHLGTGLENSNNRASADAAATAAARSFVKPYMRKKASQLTRDLIPELGNPGEQVLFRIDAIEALQEDKTETAKRDNLELTHITVNEMRKRKGQSEVPGGNFFVIGNSAVDAIEGPSSATKPTEPDGDEEDPEKDDEEVAGAGAPKKAPPKNRPGRK